MQTVKVFRAGNSDVVAIPRPLLTELGIKTGAEVVVEKVPDAEALLVMPAGKKTKRSGVSAEFERWLAAVLREDAELLDRLA